MEYIVTYYLREKGVLRRCPSEKQLNGFFHVLKYHNLCFGLSYKDCVSIVYQYVQSVEKTPN